MTPAKPPDPSRCAGPGTGPAQVITRRLAASAAGVHGRGRGDHCELVILNVPGARSCLTLTGTGWAQWHYEPATGPATDPATLTAIIEHILGAPRAAGCAPGPAAYQAFPLKGAIGRSVQDRGLTVALRVSEDLESFEATTDIEVTSPARPWPGLVRLSDNGHIEWDCDYRADDRTKEARKYGRVIHREPLKNRALPGTIKAEERPGIPGRNRPERLRH